ncbi:MAG: hypothetical protein ACFCUR_08730 [Rhodomicrobiaceae bacterium]
MRKAIIGIACLIALLVSACSGRDPVVARLEGAEPQRLSFGPPSEVQQAFTSQMQACWFNGPSAPLEGYQYDARPVIMDTANGPAELRQIRIKADREEQSFIVQFFPFNNNTLISTRNLSLPIELATRLKHDVETWIFGRSACEEAPSSASAVSPGLIPQTSSTGSRQKSPGGWGTSQEPAPGTVNRY